MDVLGLRRGEAQPRNVVRVGRSVLSELKTGMRIYAYLGL